MTHRKLRNRPGVHSIYLPTHRLPERARPGEYKRPSSDEYTLAVALKPLVIQRVLSFGFDVFFLDVDIALLRDPRPWLHRSPTADLQVSLNYDDRPAQQKVTGHMQKSTEVMKMMGKLCKVSEISATMQEMQKEMMKVCRPPMICVP